MQNIKNYFQAFDLEESFDLDNDILEQKSIKKQQLFHPDKATTEDEKIEFLKISADLNDAYQILNDDVLRATYLLELKGITVSKEKDNSHKPSQANLIFQMELREDIFEIEKNISELKDEEKKLKKMFSDSCQIFNKHFTSSNLELAANEAIKMQYLKKLRADLKSFIKAKKIKERS